MRNPFLENLRPACFANSCNLAISMQKTRIVRMLPWPTRVLILITHFLTLSFQLIRVNQNKIIKIKKINK